MVTYEFGNPIYIAPLKNLDIQITDKRNEANTWHSQYDLTKLAYHKSVTGYKQLIFEKI